MSFSASESVFLQFLRAALWGGMPQIESEKVELNDVINIARSHSVMGIISRVILDSIQKQAQPSNKLRLQCKSIIVSNVMAYDKLEDLVKEVTDLLNSKGVSSVLLKGQGISRYYPLPQLRQCGDIDLYVGKDQYEATYNILKEQYRCVDSFSEIWNDKHFNVKANGNTIEVHSKSDEYPNKKYDKVYQRISDKGLTKDLVDCVIKDTIVKTPADTFNAFYVFSHMFHHFVFGGVGLRQLCDWALFLKSKNTEIDKNELNDILVSMNMLSPWQDFAYLIVNYLGCPEDAVPFYTENVNQRKVARILSLILEEGNFGQNTPYYKNRSESFFINKCKSLIWHIKRFVNLAIFYPSHAYHNFIQRLNISFKSLVKHK